MKFFALDSTSALLMILGVVALLSPVSDLHLRPTCYLCSSDFSNLQVKQKFGSKNRIIREIRSKITVLTEERQTAFDSSYLEVKKEGSRNRDSTVFPKYLE